MKLQAGQDCLLPGWREDHRGTVSKVAGGRFRVTWDDPYRRRNEPRQRFWYPESAWARFMEPGTRTIRAEEPDGI